MWLEYAWTAWSLERNAPLPLQKTRWLVHHLLRETHVNEVNGPTRLRWLIIHNNPKHWLGSGHQDFHSEGFKIRLFCEPGTLANWGWPRWPRETQDVKLCQDVSKLYKYIYIYTNVYNIFYECIQIHYIIYIYIYSYIILYTHIHCVQHCLTTLVTCHCVHFYNSLPPGLGDLAAPMGSCWSEGCGCDFDTMLLRPIQPAMTLTLLASHSLHPSCNQPIRFKNLKNGNQKWGTKAMGGAQSDSVPRNDMPATWLWDLAGDHRLKRRSWLTHTAKTSKRSKGKCSLSYREAQKTLLHCTMTSTAQHWAQYWALQHVMCLIWQS